MDGFAKNARVGASSALAAVVLAMSVGRAYGAETAPVDRSALLDAIERVESGRGATSSNLYQIREIYYRDWCRITGRRFDRLEYLAAVVDRARSRAIVNRWWDYWIGRGRPGTAEALARMHNGGPDGARRDATMNYWMRVKKEMR